MRILSKKMTIHRLRALSIFILACSLWAARMPLVQAYYERTLRLGYYPPEADSIGIPIASEAILTALLAPVLALCLWLVLRRSPPRYTWLAWSSGHRVWSGFWTLLFGLFICQTGLFLLENLRIGLPLNALANAGWAMIWLELRAAVVSQLEA